MYRWSQLTLTRRALPRVRGCEPRDLRGCSLLGRSPLGVVNAEPCSCTMPKPRILSRSWHILARDVPWPSVLKGGSTPVNAGG